jgi:hypothetical protein
MSGTRFERQAVFNIDASTSFRRRRREARRGRALVIIVAIGEKQTEKKISPAQNLNTSFVNTRWNSQSETGSSIVHGEQ